MTTDGSISSHYKHPTAYVSLGHKIDLDQFLGDITMFCEINQMSFKTKNYYYVTIPTEFLEDILHLGGILRGRKIDQPAVFPEFILDEKVLVISDSNKADGIAGIIGSSNSSCDLETSEVLLEAAFFQASTIAYSGRKLNILSDARFRFERGVDENTCESGIDLASQLILEIKI